MTMDPKELLFSLPTLCDPSPSVDALPPSGTHRSLHEDDWRQIEFVARINQAHIHKELGTLAAFKEHYRRRPGWTKVYVRSEHPTSLGMLGLRYSDMPAFSVSGLTMGSGAPLGGTVRGGFAFSDGGAWFIYGQRANDGRVLQLALSPGRSLPSERLAQAVSRLTQTSDLLLIDWYAGSVVDSSSLEAFLAWAVRYDHS
jgi:hypothetical protein